MNALAKLERGWRRQSGQIAGQVSRPRRVVLWCLTAWTAVGAVALLVAQGSFSRMAAAGLRDGPGQRLLGVQWAALALCYVLIARGRIGGLLAGWLPLTVQALTALVILYDTAAGHRGFGAAWPALCVALLFTLLLAAFQLAGEPVLDVGPDGRRPAPEESARRSAQPPAAFRANFSRSAGAPTQRLDPATPSRPSRDNATSQRRAPDEPREDEPVLGA